MSLHFGGLGVTLGMKIKELLEALSVVSVSEIRINGNHFKSFDGVYNSENGLGDLDVVTWFLFPENDGLVLVIHGDYKLTVSDVLTNVHFDDENTIVIYNNTDVKVYDSDEDSVFVLCELLCLDVKEYIQIHRGKHQIIEIHLKNY